jgi:magnesium-protoporphyrin IX monomethyl ester (oxidative) cyclase
MEPTGTVFRRERRAGGRAASDKAIRRVMLLSLPAVTEVGDDHLAEGHSFHLGLAYLAAVLRNEGFEVAILDCFAEASWHVRRSDEPGWQGIGLEDEEIVAAVRKFAPDVIGMTIPFSCQHYVGLEVGYRIKAAFPSVVMVAGRNHVTAVPGELDRSIFDYLVVGEGEHAFLSLVRALDAGRSPDAIPGVLGPKPGPHLPPKLIGDLDELPFPAIDLFPLEKIWASSPRWIIMVATRGCVYECTFCSIHTIMGRRIRRRSVENVIAEIRHWKRLYDIEAIYFEDDNLTANKAWAKQLFRRIAEGGFGLRLHARNGIRADTVDEEMLRLMKAAGFQDFNIAPESGSQKTLDEIIRKRMKLKDCERAVSLARAANMGINSFFIIGFPEESWSDLEQTVRYAQRLKEMGCGYFWISLASPYPGTRFYDECRERGLIGDDFDFRRCRTVDYQVANPHYSAGELKAFRRKAMDALSPPRPTLLGRVRNWLALLREHPAGVWKRCRYGLEWRSADATRRLRGWVRRAQVRVSAHTR